MQHKRYVWQGLVLLLLLPWLYLLSFIPLFWGWNHRVLPGRVDMSNAFLLWYGYPIEAAHRHGPEWLRDRIAAYGRFLRSL